MSQDSLFPEHDLAMRVCPNCKVSKPYSQFPQKNRKGLPKGRCADCTKEYKKQWDADHIEQQKAYRQRPDVMERHRGIALKQYYDAKELEQTDGTPEVWRNRRLKNLYDIDSEEYERRFEAQQGCCAIDGQPETAKDRGSKILRLCVDHDHETGAVRDLLCIRHNRGLGCFKDDPDEFLAAAEYVLKHRDVLRPLLDAL